MAIVTRGLYLSVTSGALAATASVFGKLSMSPSICCQLFNGLNESIGLFNKDNNNWCHSSQTSLILRTFQGLMFAVMIITNLLMWTQFTKALKHYTNSLHVIVVNTSTNFFLTAFYGSILFGEILSTLWWLGSTFIVIGLLIMKTSNQLKSDVKKEL